MSCDCDFILPSRDGWEPHYFNCRSVWCKEHGTDPPKNDDGTLRLRNEHLKGLDCDVLYHLGFDTKNNDLPAMFGDVKFVCMGGTKHRMKEFAQHMATVLNRPEETLVNLTKHSHRYAMYKVGPVLSVNHGMGIPSMTILLQEIFKLLSYAKAKDAIIFRIGTSGGLDIPPGSVVVASWALNGTMKKTYDIPILGKVAEFPAVFDKRINQELMYLADDMGFPIYSGGTMACDDFYRGQGRLDGPLCDYTESDKMGFLKRLIELGVKNIEMEATAFAAFTKQAGLRSADVCVTLVDRFKEDQVTSSKSLLLEYQKRPMELVGKYISEYCDKISKQ